jgi:hypothetical protein
MEYLCGNGKIFPGPNEEQEVHKAIEFSETDTIITMTSPSDGRPGSRRRKGSAYNQDPAASAGKKPAGVHESAGGLQKDERIESLLTEIVTRLDRIEEKIDENVYPPESAIRPEFVKKVKKAQADIKKGKGKTYESMDAFIRAISE